MSHSLLARLFVPLWLAHGPWLLQAGALHCPVQLLVVLAGNGQCQKPCCRFTITGPTALLAWLVCSGTGIPPCMLVCGTPCMLPFFVQGAATASCCFNPSQLQRSRAVWAVVASGLQHASLEATLRGRRRLGRLDLACMRVLVMCAGSAVLHPKRA